MFGGFSPFGLLFGQLFKARQFTGSYLGPVIPDSFDLSGKVFVVTGASTGLGKSLVQELAIRGATIYMISRSLDKLNSAKTEIESHVSATFPQRKPTLLTHSLDLSDVDSVNEFCKSEFQEVPIHCLFNNGGALPTTRQMVSNDKLESTVASHLVSPYLLSKGLEDNLLKAKGRVIMMSSAGLYSAALDMKGIENGFIDYANAENKVDGALVYAICKRAMLEIADSLAEEFKSFSIPVITMHPGWVQTPGLKPLLEQNPVYGAVTFRDVKEGAMSMLYMAVSDDIGMKDSGEFFFDAQKVEKHQWLAGTTTSEEDKIKLQQFVKLFLPNKDNQI